MTTSANPSVAYLTTHYPAVSHTFIQNEVRALRAIGHRVVTFAINPTLPVDVLTDKDREELAATRVLKQLPHRFTISTLLRAGLLHPVALLSTMREAWRFVGLDLGRGIRRVMQVGEGVLLERLCRREGVRHVHAHFGQAPANVAMFAAHFHNRAHRRSMMRWSMTVHGPQDCLAEPRDMLRSKVGAAAFVVAVADFTKAQVLRQIPLDLWPAVHVVRCGVHLDVKPRGPIDDVAVPRVLIVARISPEKGHATALEALAILRDRGLPFTLEIVGPGDFEESLAAFAEQLGVRDQVRVIGALPPVLVAEQMRSADIVCLPSMAEGLPVTLMEAMVVGTPVVASGISGIPELIEHAVTGLLVIPARPDLLADAWALLGSDVALRTRLAAAALERVRALHDITANGQALSSLLCQFAAGAVVGGAPR